MLIDIVFDGPPGPKPGNFVEVENTKGEGINAGEWIDRGDGYWALRLKVVGNGQVHAYTAPSESDEKETDDPFTPEGPKLQNAIAILDGVIEDMGDKVPISLHACGNVLRALYKKENPDA